MILKYIMCLQGSYQLLAVRHLFSLFFFLGGGCVIMHKANFLVHKSLWASVIIFLEKKIPEMALLCQREWTFLRLLIYIANLPSGKVVPVYSSSSTLYSIFMKMTEQLQEARLEQDFQDQHLHLCVQLITCTIDKETEGR